MLLWNAFLHACHHLVDALLASASFHLKPESTNRQIIFALFDARVNSAHRSVNSLMIFAHRGKIDGFHSAGLPLVWAVEGIAE